MNGQPPYMNGYQLPLTEAEKKELKSRAERAKRRALDFALWTTGRGGPDVAARCMEALDEYTGREPDPARNSDAQAWHHHGQLHLWRWIKDQARRGEEIEHGKR